MPEIPYSLAGRVIKHRSTPWYDKRIRSQPVYEREEQIPMDHTMVPPGYGQPLTDAEREQRHFARFGTTDLPPRGTGRGVQYGAGVQRLQGFDWGSFFVGGVLAFILGYFVFTASGRRIGYAAGQRIERRVR